MEVKSWVAIYILCYATLFPYFFEPEFMMHPTKCSVVYRPHVKALKFIFVMMLC